MSELIENKRTEGETKEFHVKHSDLPVCCPPQNDSIWNAHPRVYLVLNEAHREANCPYCDAKFILVN